MFFTSSTGTNVTSTTSAMKPAFCTKVRNARPNVAKTILRRCRRLNDRVALRGAPLDLRDFVALFAEADRVHPGGHREDHRERDEHGRAPPRAFFRTLRRAANLEDAFPAARF